METSADNNHKQNSENPFPNNRSLGEDPDYTKSSIVNSGNVFRPRSTGSWSTILGVGNMVYPPHLRTRRKTYSESSETSSVGDGPLDLSSASSSVDRDPKSIISSQSPFNSHSRISESENLSFGNSNQVVYDVDGKFPYTYYESKPTLYDIDGTHRYKYYKAFKPTPYTEGAPHHENRPWIYDPAEGMVKCLTAKDLKTEMRNLQDGFKTKNT